MRSLLEPRAVSAARAKVVSSMTNSGSPVLLGELRVEVEFLRANHANFIASSDLRGHTFGAKCSSSFTFAPVR